jgi:hypothetical protein
MPVGSKWQLFVPPSLSDGENGAGNAIQPNTALVFDVELLSIHDANKSEASAADAAQAAIKEAMDNAAAEVKAAAE